MLSPSQTARVFFWFRDFTNAGKEAITMTTQIALHYGAAELRASYEKYALRGLMVAVMIHIGLIGSYYLAGMLTTDTEPHRILRMIPYNEIGPPPSVHNSQAPPAVSIAAPTLLPQKGSPVPVPDAEISPEATIQTQIEMNSFESPESSGTGRPGTVLVPGRENVAIEEEPGIFQIVEKLPVPVVNPTPAYPELPRRAGVEGTVWVNIWVTKEGKVRKAVVLKSDSELFNQAALDAAQKWVFTPAVMNSGPVAVWVSIPFRFKLNGAR